jgi:hypothetical protein
MAKGWFTCKHCGTDHVVDGAPWVDLEGRGANRRALPKVEVRCQNGHESVVDGNPRAVPVGPETHQEER